MFCAEQLYFLCGCMLTFIIIVCVAIPVKVVYMLHDRYVFNELLSLHGHSLFVYA